MRNPARKFVAITSLLLLTGLASQLLFNSNPQPEEKAQAVLGNARNLEIAYQRWKAQARQNGADRNLVLALSYTKGLSAEFTKAYGQTQLDLTDGTLSVEVSGLPKQDDFDLWLVDNRESSVNPEPSDPMLRVGRLQHEGASATLRARLDRDALSQFKLDRVVVARAGQTPVEAGLLFGSPSYFQRLYYSELLGPLARPGEARVPSHPATGSRNLLSAPFSALIARPAYADASDDLMDIGDDVALGEISFFTETFEGNGRTCGTCHRAENNLTIDPKFIRKLPPDDPLFVAEFMPALSENFEQPDLMRKHGLILENVDGMEDLPNKFVMRGVPHTLGLPLSLSRDASISGTFPDEMTGWSGDGAPPPGGGLRDFILGAINQHYPKTLARVPGVDFRIPTEDELDNLEAFQLSLGIQTELSLPTLMLTDQATLASTDPNNASTGQDIFRSTAARCNVCHNEGGASASFRLPLVENRNFNTGVEESIKTKALRKGNAAMKRDGGFGATPPNLDGSFGDKEFNTPRLVESADTGPFFHNNSERTIEDAVRFYTSTAFANSPSGTPAIQLTETQVVQVGAFLRVINAAFANTSVAIAMLNNAKDASADGKPDLANNRIEIMREEANDAITVLKDRNLHPIAVQHLKTARGSAKKAGKTTTTAAKNAHIDDAIEELELAFQDMVQSE
ncbi:MAG: hypothetical protein ACREYF_26575 [Gammaproteobacteria bacterium]